MIVTVLEIIALLSVPAISIGTGENECDTVAISSETSPTCSRTEVNITDCANITEEIVNYTASEDSCTLSCDRPAFCNNSGTYCLRIYNCSISSDTNCTYYHELCAQPCTNGEMGTGSGTCQCLEDACPQQKNASCTEECLNGGTCQHGATKCTCPEGWTGDTCNTSFIDSSQMNNGNRTIIIIASTVGACVLVLSPVAILLAYLAVYQYRRRRRVKFIQADIRVSSTPTEPNITSSSDAVLFGESVAYQVPEDTKDSEEIASREAWPKEDDVSLTEDSLDTKDPIS